MRLFFEPIDHDLRQCIPDYWREEISPKFRYYFSLPLLVINEPTVHVRVGESSGERDGSTDCWVAF